MSATLADVRCIFKTFRAESPEARARLIRLAERVDTLTRARGYAVDVLEELRIDDPVGPNILGFKYSASGHIAVRLREPREGGAWLPEDAVLATLCHELAHFEHGGHTPEFYALAAEHRRAIGLDLPTETDAQHCATPAAAIGAPERGTISIPVRAASRPSEEQESHAPPAAPLGAAAVHAITAAVLAYGLFAINPPLSLLGSSIALLALVCLWKGRGPFRTATLTVAVASIIATASAFSAVRSSRGRLSVVDTEATDDEEAQDTGTVPGDFLGLAAMADPDVWGDSWQKCGQWVALLAFSVAYATVLYRGSCVPQQRWRCCVPSPSLLPTVAVIVIGLCGADLWLAVLVVAATAGLVRAGPELVRWSNDGAPRSDEDDRATSSPIARAMSGVGRTMQEDSETVTLLPPSPSPRGGTDEQLSYVAAAGEERLQGVTATAPSASREERAAAVRAAAEARVAAFLQPSLARKARAAAHAAACAEEEARAAAARRKDWGSGRVGGGVPINDAAGYPPDAAVPRALS